MSSRGDQWLVRPPSRSLRTFLPVLTWLPRYRRQDLRPDVIAGLTLAALLVPESLGYAGVAGVPPEVGLYAALGAVLAYVLTGGTSILVVGPASAVAALSASIVGELGGPTDPVVLAAALALLSGLILVVAGLLRVGWVVNFISTSVLHAFVTGLSISIIIGQLDGLLGVRVEGETAIVKLVDVLGGIGGWDWLTVGVGVASVAVLMGFERYAPRVPGALVVIALGVLLVLLVDLDGRGVAVVGEIPAGLPHAGIPELGLRSWLELLAGSTALVLVGFSEGYAAAAAVADEHDEEVDADQELYSAGVANLASGVLGGLAVSGSLSKSAASSVAGARTQIANLTAGLIVLATLLFLGPFFELLPEPVLAAIVIVAVLRTADPRRLLAMRSVNTFDFVAGTLTLVLALVWATLPALIVGVLLSLAFVVRRASFPDIVELRRDSRGDFVRAQPARPDEPDPAVGPVAVVRIDAPLIYANARRLRSAVRTLVRARSGLRVLVLDGEVIADLDTAGAATLAELDDELTRRGIQLRLARMHARARDQIGRSGLARRFEGRVFTTMAEAFEADPEPGLER